MDAVECADEAVHARCVPREFAEVFERVHHSAAGVGEGEHEAFICDEGFRAGLFAGERGNNI